MTLVEEYKKQNAWRAWYRYIQKIPLNKDQVVYDLGCSIGEVSKLFAPYVQKVIGFDKDQMLLDEARKLRIENCEFINEDISNLDKHRKCDVIWSSFTLAYINDPQMSVQNWLQHLRTGGYLVIIDIDRMFSIHLPQGDPFRSELEFFEKESGKNKAYDFMVGGKIRQIMMDNGLDLIVSEENWYDKELNFCGAAATEVVENWKARLERMSGLKLFLGPRYSDFCLHYIDIISRPDHVANNGVKFFVGKKLKNFQAP